MSTSRTIPEALHEAARRFGHADALVDDDRTLSFLELEAAAVHVARALASSGIEPGDRVSIWGPNHIDWAIAALGVYSAGAVITPLNTRFKGPEAGHVLRTAEVKLVISVGEFLGVDYVAMLEQVPDLPALAEVVLLPGYAHHSATNWDDFIARADATSADEIARREAAVRPDDLCDIIFTSGTTGAPKGTMLLHEASIKTYLAWSQGLGLAEGDRFLVVFPYFQTSGLKAGILACLLFGVANIPQAVFDVPTVIERVMRHRVSVLPGAPTVFQSILNHPDLESFDLSSLRLAVTGGAATPVEVIRRMREDLHLDTVVTAYGLTETTGTATMCNTHDTPETIATTVGRAIPGVEIKIVDDDGAAVAAGGPGEILVRGYNVMKGYFNDPVATAETIDADGWLKTGDIGTMDGAGLVRITDRKKDMFIVGGFNVYPAELEGTIVKHPDVGQVAVIGMPDDRLGEVGVAFIVPRADHDLGTDDLVAWCRDRMANYKVPRRIEVVEELPVNPGGKVQKFKLRDLL